MPPNCCANQHKSSSSLKPRSLRQNQHRSRPLLKRWKRSVGAKPRFVPQGGLWNLSVESTKGILRAMLEKRYDELPSVPPSPHPDNLDADTRLTGSIRALSRIY